MAHICKSHDFIFVLVTAIIRIYYPCLKFADTTHAELHAPFSVLWAPVHVLVF